MNQIKKNPSKFTPKNIILNSRLKIAYPHLFLDYFHLGNWKSGSSKSQLTPNKESSTRLIIIFLFFIEFSWQMQSLDHL